MAVSQNVLVLNRRARISRSIPRSIPYWTEGSPSFNTPRSIPPFNTPVQYPRSIPLFNTLVQYPCSISLFNKYLVSNLDTSCTRRPTHTHTDTRAHAHTHNHDTWLCILLFGTASHLQQFHSQTTLQWQAISCEKASLLAKCLAASLLAN